MERYSYKVSLSKRALKLYEGCAEVRNWYDEMSALKSSRTSQDYVDALAGFLADVGKSPSELIKLTPKEAYELMKGWAVKKVRSGSVTSGRVHAIWQAVKNFLEFNGVKVEGRIPLKRRVQYLDKIPTKEELAQILNSSVSLLFIK